MKNNSLVFAGILLCASFVHAQVSQPCLVINPKHARIASRGDVEYRSHYSNRQLKHLSEAGVNVVEWPKRVPIDVDRACGESAAVVIERMEQHEARLNDRPDMKRCIEYHTSASGEECVLWTTLADPRVQH